MKTLSMTAAALGAAVLLALPARAQSAADADSAAAPNSLRKGAVSFSLEGPWQGSGSSAGIWKMVGDRTNLGVVVGLGAGTSDREHSEGAPSDGTDIDASLGVAVRRYANPTGQIVPFVSGEVMGYGWRSGVDIDDGEASQETYTLGGSVRGGVGVEWFPVRRVSLSGSTGLGLTWTRQHSDSDGSGISTEITENRFGFSTFSSGIAIQIYF